MKDGWVFTQTMIGDDPHDPPHNQDFDVNLEKIIEKVHRLIGVNSTYASGKVDGEQLMVYFNLPGKDDPTQDAPGCPDINITIKDGRLHSLGLGPCKGPFGGRCVDGCCTENDHRPERWLMLRGIVSVIKENGPAEPFLRFLDTLIKK